MSTIEKRLIQAADLYEFQTVSDARISPDGEYIVYVQQRVDQKTEKKYSNLWVVPTAGGPARQFTYGDQNDRAPQWSPDGSDIAFVSNRKDEKQSQLQIIPFGGGEARPLSDLKGEFGGFKWSPDGSKIAFAFRQKDAEAIEREEDEQKKKLGVVARHITRINYKLDAYGFLPKERWHIWTLDVASGEATQITEGDVYDETQPNWSPDGKELVYVSNQASDPDIYWDQDDLFIIPAAGGEARSLGLPKGSKSDPAYSPDGRHIAYYRHSEREAIWQLSSLWVTPADGSASPTNLTESFDFDVAHPTINDTSGGEVMSPTWSNDSATLYFQIGRHGSTTLNAISVDGADLQEVVGPGGTVGAFTFDQDQSKLAYFQDSIDDPGQLWVKDLASGDARKLTTFNRDVLDQIDLGEIEEIWYKGADGNDLQGWILKPPGFDPNQKYPAILEIHGGPMAQYGQAFMHEFYFLAAQGYVVFYTNPRGGAGYGSEHTKAIFNDWGNKDYADVMAWADLVFEKPYVDSSRVGVTGGSYGGFMTNWTIGHTDRFKAAVTQRSVSNFISMYGSSDLNDVWRCLFGADKFPWNDLENYWRQSPIKYIANVKTPTLVIHSEQDLRCDIEQGEQVFIALKVLGIDTELVRFPEEPHGLSRAGRTDRRIVRLNHILRWFDKHLK